MGFLRNRTVRHCTGLESLADTLNGFYLINWYTAVFIEIEVEQTAECDLVILACERLRILLECIVAAGPSCLLEQMNCLGSVKVLALAAAEFVAACTLNLAADMKSERIVSGSVERLCAAAYISEKLGLQYPQNSC